MRRLFILLPFGAGIAVLVGGNFAWAGAAAMMRGNMIFGGLFLVYGVGGIVLGASLWRAYRQYRKPAAPPEARS